jgi:hypothetical protein
MSTRKELLIVIFIFVLIFSMSLLCSGVPVGPSRITYLHNGTRGTSNALSRDQDARGTITLVVMNVTQQTSYWKAYVGNVSGKITLDDEYNFTIYDWKLAVAGGQVYATRKATTVGWTNVRCANKTMVENEQALINHTAIRTDSLNKTFGKHNHVQFYVGGLQFKTSSCNYTAHTYVSDAPQSSSFTEVLLYDSEGYIVYTSVLNRSIAGYNNGRYDFQMLVGEKGQGGFQVPVSYYFYVELV